MYVCVCVCVCTRARVCVCVCACACACACVCVCLCACVCVFTIILLRLIFSRTHTLTPRSHLQAMDGELYDRARNAYMLYAQIDADAANLVKAQFEDLREQAYLVGNIHYALL